MKFNPIQLLRRLFGGASMESTENARPEPQAPTAPGGPSDPPGDENPVRAEPIDPVKIMNQEELQKAEPREPEGLRRRIVDQLRTVFDPEIPVNIFDLGLIYVLKIETSGKVEIKMTLTAPNCPVAGTLPGEIESKVRDIQGVAELDFSLVWDPPFTQEMMSEAARLQLGLL